VRVRARPDNEWDKGRESNLVTFCPKTPRPRKLRKPTKPGSARTITESAQTVAPSNESRGSTSRNRVETTDERPFWTASGASFLGRTTLGNGQSRKPHVRSETAHGVDRISTRLAQTSNRALLSTFFQPVAQKHLGRGTDEFQRVDESSLKSSLSLSRGRQTTSKICRLDHGHGHGHG
jgi:hypothetical protein